MYFSFEEKNNHFNKSRKAVLNRTDFGKRFYMIQKENYVP